MSSLWKFWVKGNQANRVKEKAKRVCSDKHSLAHQSLPRTPSEVVVRPRVVGPTASWWQSLSAAWLWALPLLTALGAQTLMTS